MTDPNNNTPAIYRQPFPAVPKYGCGDAVNSGIVVHSVCTSSAWKFHIKHPDGTYTVECVTHGE